MINKTEIRTKSVCTKTKTSKYYYITFVILMSNLFINNNEYYITKCVKFYKRSYLVFKYTKRTLISFYHNFSLLF